MSFSADDTANATSGALPCMPCSTSRKNRMCSDKRMRSSLRISPNRRTHSTHSVSDDAFCATACRVGSSCTMEPDASLSLKQFMKVRSTSMASMPRPDAMHACKRSVTTAQRSVLGTIRSSRLPTYSMSPVCLARSPPIITTYGATCSEKKVTSTLHKRETTWSGVGGSGMGLDSATKPRLPSASSKRQTTSTSLLVCIFLAPPVMRCFSDRVARNTAARFTTSMWGHCSMHWKRMVFLQRPVLNDEQSSEEAEGV
mmetsp:Transcript_52291/g.131313  ORF Transcript_52291/g.131313 Transcript_52291/m.131313 type:complete len:256 (+) Transcript_52291:1982-2749(+)